MRTAINGMSKWVMFEYIFHLFCLFTTAGLVGFWTYKFSMNDDLSIVEYKQYDMKDADDTSESPYLSHTMCFRNPFLASKGIHLNASEKSRVESYLSGTEGEEFPDFNYNSLALNLTDYVKDYYIRWRNGTHQYFKPSEVTWKTVDRGFNGFWLGKFFRCFTLKSPNSDVAVMAAKIENKAHNQGMLSSKKFRLSFTIIQLLRLLINQFYYTFT